MDHNNKVFVIHGRNEAARLAMFDFLRSIGLHPLEWSEVVLATGKGSPYIGEVLERGFSIAQAAVALMTPDDVAKLRKPLQGNDELRHETELTPQPRQNVLFEAGMAMGLFPDRTVIVEIGKLRPMSDTIGRHVVRMDGSVAKRQDLANRLQSAGCAVELTGTDWHTSGDFAGCLIRTDKDSQEPESGGFAGCLDGLSGDELYWLAKAIDKGSQTLNDCYPNDTAPKILEILVSKGFLEPVPVPQTLEEMQRRLPLPHNIPTPVWRHLNEHKTWLFQQAIEKNKERADRLPHLKQWLQRHIPISRLEARE